MATLLVACGRSRLEEEWQLTVDQLAGDPLELVDWFPADGTAGVGRKVDPYLLLNRPINDEEQALLGGTSITDLEDGDGLLGSPVVDSDGAGISLQFAELQRNERYQLSFVPPFPDQQDPLLSAFDTVPPAGAAFNMASGLIVQSFGGNPDHATVLGDLFEPGVYPLWVLQVLGAEEAAAGQPWRGDFVFAPARWEPEEEFDFYLHRDYGYVARLLDVVVDSEGDFLHEQDGVFLPLWSSWDVILLYLDDVQIEGHFEVEPTLQLTELRLTGVLGTRWLLRLAEEEGGWAEAVNVMEPDVDTNGNDRPDSATFSLFSNPRPLGLSELDL
jgi:hypothetical protein